MAKVAIKTFCAFLSLFTLSCLCCSGTLVGFSYDARSSSTSSIIETISFLKKSNVPPSQIRLVVKDNRVLDSVSKISIPVDLYVTQTVVTKLWKSKSSATEWLKTHCLSFLPHVNITSIIVNSSKSAKQKQLNLPLPNLHSIQSALESINLNHWVKVSTTLSLSMLENSNKSCKKDLEVIVEFIRRSRSSIIVETVIDEELSLGNQFIQSMIKKAVSAARIIPWNDIPMVLNVKSSVFPSTAETAEFTKKVKKTIKNQDQIMDRFSGIFVEIPPSKKSKQLELKRIEEEIYPSSYHRELLDTYKSISITKTTSHDSTANPAKTPFTAPTTSPTPLIITIPSNPGTAPPTNPVTPPLTNPVNTPSNVPVTTPVPIPSNPVTPSATVPVTNSVTTTVPAKPTVTNPVTTYPISPPGSIPNSMPVVTPITVGTPLTVVTPPPPTTTFPMVNGRSWCVAKTDAQETTLQAALDYACSIGGADCTAIQPAGNCYNPNTLHDHTSYAFNSYYQKNPVQSSCDFGGTAIIVGINPSSGTCIYPSSSFSSSSSVLNTNYPNTSTAIIGSGPPAITSDSASVSENLWFLIMLTSLIKIFQRG